MLGVEASVWLVAMLSVVLAPAAQAHHGWGAYDVGAALTLDGMVVGWNADAGVVELRLRAQGKPWIVVLASPALMAARGKQIGEIAIGDRLIVVGFRHRADAGELRAARITHAGFTIELA